MEESSDFLSRPIGGLVDFDFSLCERNFTLKRQMEGDGHGNELKRIVNAESSGTTIVGAIFKDGVVLAADSRSTQGNLVSNKNSMKVHYLTDKIYACGAGTAVDLEKVAKIVGAELRLFELNSGLQARVVMAARRLRQYLFKYMGRVQCYYLVGGIDPTGSHLFTIQAHGNAVRKAIEADGSGSMCAIAELESGYKSDMTVDECVSLIKRGIEAGMRGDNSSGNKYNILVITTDGIKREGPITPSFAQAEKIENQFNCELDSLKVIQSKFTAL